MGTSFLNKVVIIDDQFEEALPIINSLSRKGIFSIYWDGKFDTKPESPLEGVRLVILDMRFSSTTDSRTIITHLFTLINSTISTTNGPYILCVWSKHNNEYLDDFKRELEVLSGIPKPYLITSIEKSDFIERVNEMHEVYEELASALEDDSRSMFKNEVLEILQNIGLKSKEKVLLKDDSTEKLLNHLEEKLKNVNSLSALLLWEELAYKSASSLVNKISNMTEFNNTWDNNIKTLIQQLATANAGKSLEEDVNDYILNAFSSLNNMLPDELWNQLLQVDLVEDDFNFIKDPVIQHTVNQDVYSISKPGKKFIIKKNNREFESFKDITTLENCENKPLFIELYDKYLKILGQSNSKLLCEKSTFVESKKPGSIYRFDDASLSNQVSASILKNEITSPNPHKLVKLDISSACDYSQNKLRRVRLLLGIMVESDNFSQINDSEDIYCTPEIEVGNQIVRIAFNFHFVLNQAKEEINNSDRLLVFRDMLLTEIKHKLGSYISRVGIINL